MKSLLSHRLSMDEINEICLLVQGEPLNFLILDLMEPLLRAKILHNSSIVFPIA